MREIAFVVALAVAVMQGGPVRNGSISGVVVQSGTNMPIEDVQIELSAFHADNPTFSVPFKTVKTVTDDRGQFMIRDLPSGKFRIHWQREGYYPPPLSDIDNGVQIRTHGGGVSLNVENNNAVSVKASGSIVPVSLASDESLKDLTLALIPGGVISGSVRDPQGRPLAGARIAALMMGYDSGYAFLSEVRSAIADDRGQFRFFGLHPGKYYVRAEHQETNEQYPPRLYSYFPGVTAAGEALAISVKSGTEAGGNNFSVQPGAARILGSTTFSPPSLGAPQERDGVTAKPIVSYFLVPSDANSVVDLQPAYTYGNSQVPNGFAIGGVRSGRYEMYAVTEAEASNGDYENYVGRTAANVGSGDVENIAVVIGAESTVNGRVLGMKGGGLFEKVLLSWRLQAAVFPESEALESWEHIDSDGRFKLRVLPGARYDLAMEGLPENVAVVDIRQKGVSVFDEGVVADDRAPIEVLVSGNTGAIDVRVTDSNQQPVRNAIVALVPTAEHRKNHALYQRAKFDAATSKYLAIDAIPTGEYTLFAWDEIPDDAEMNAEFLREFESRGVPVVVDSKKTIHVQLPLISTQDSAAR